LSGSASRVILIRKFKRRNLITTFIILSALLGTLIAQRYIFSQGLSDYPAGAAGVEIKVIVTNGETGTAIAEQLASLHVIAKASTLINKMIQNRVIGIAPGIHTIHTIIPSDQAIAELLDQKRITDVVLVLPGSTVSDILTKIHSLSSLKQSDQLQTLLPSLANPGSSLEGQLAPNQYTFAPGTTTHEALVNILQNFSNERAAVKLDLGYKGFTAYQVLTIASMIQIEADLADYAKVARVIYNRLRIGMPLQLNSTVQYALGIRGQIGLSRKSTQVESPYNTYLHTGLPPTPICNPSIEAINAAMNPLDGNWLYFITVTPHDTRFTNSFSTFESWVSLYNHNVAAGAFK
jgi:UPF0755 protein